jgi:hypothetical protein
VRVFGALLEVGERLERRGERKNGAFTRKQIVQQYKLQFGNNREPKPRTSELIGLKIDMLLVYLSMSRSKRLKKWKELRLHAP